MEPALELARRQEDLRRRRARSTASTSSCRAAPLYGVIGPNGAGKTTCIRMIMSILFPDSGELSVLGQRSALEAKDRIGYLPEERGVYRKMRVGAFLTYMAQLKGVRAGRCGGARAASCSNASACAAPSSKRCEELSKGMLQRVQFVGAVIHQPDLLILDEPFSGLDPVSVRLLRERDSAGARARRHHPALDARHGQRRRDVPARGDDPPGPQGAGRADGRAAAAVRSADASTSSRSTPTPTSAPLAALPGVSSASSRGRRRLHGSRWSAGTDPAVGDGAASPRSSRRRASSWRGCASRTCSCGIVAGRRRAATTRRARCAPACRPATRKERCA